MKTITTEVFTFDELDEKAKEKARDWYRESAFDDYQQAWEQVKDDAESIGLKIAALDGRRGNSGEFIDGAFNCANKIISEHGESCETHKTAAAFLAAFSALPQPEDDDCRADDFDAIEGDFLNSLLEDYRIMYEKDCDYYSSAEYIDETIEVNEYTFTKDGKRFG